MRFISEIKSNKLHLAPDENFKQLVQKCKRKTIETQTMFEESHYQEVELKDFVKLSYDGEISVSHFLSSPNDLERFIEDYQNLLRAKPSNPNNQNN